MEKMFLFLFALCLFMAHSCDSSEKAPHNALQEVFDSMYPSASDVDWEVKGAYTVVDFDNKNVSAKAWFDNSNKWQMTETEIRYDALPEAVKAAFKSTEYAAWKVDDVDMIERQGLETFYVIKVEKGETDVHLHYSSDGVLIKTISDGNMTPQEKNYVPKTVESTLKSTVMNIYPNARIVDVEKENGMTEVEIIDGAVSREVYLDSSNAWLYTKTDVRVSSLPQTVIEAVSASYQGYRIDDAEYIETPSAKYYLLEIEKGKSEIKVKIDTAGKIIV